MHEPPSIARCLSLMDDFAMLENIREHSIMVARTAQALLDSLRPAAGMLPSRHLVVSGALLHDIAKTQCIRTNCDHSQVGSAICADLGYPEIGEIVREHVILADFPVERYRQGIFSAKDIVYYADKRVLHDQIVSLDIRLGYIIERYGNNNEVYHALIRKNFVRCQDLEGFLFAHISYPPKELALQVSAAPPLSD
ncbi:MAG: HDIG domain-containing protein [Desulfocapsaceae bacterium]|nr:HDIG domain-containing protein [Desulfocapsaceae bacterium]